MWSDRGDEGMTTAGDLRRLCEDILDQLQGWNDDDPVLMSPSSYGMGNTFICMSDGFIDWTSIEYDDGSEEDY